MFLILPTTEVVPMLKSCNSFRTIIFAIVICLFSMAVADPDSRTSRSTRGSRSVPHDQPDGAGDADQNRIQGVVEPYADIQLAASEMGTLADVYVKEGDIVQKGQLLASLDDDVLQASLDVAEAGMNATGDLLTAQTQLDLKKAEEKKLRQLFDRHHASQQELDRILGEIRVAEARLLSVQEEMEVRRLEYARIKAQLRLRQIRSTIDGVVVRILRDRGEFVSPSDPVVCQVVQLDPLLAVFSVPNQKRGSIHPGEHVQLQIDGVALPADGIVEFVSPTGDVSSGTFRVKVRLPNADGRWHGGEKAELLLPKNDSDDIQPDRIARRTK